MTNVLLRQGYCPHLSNNTSESVRQDAADTKPLLIVRMLQWPWKHNLLLIILAVHDIQIVKYSLRNVHRYTRSLSNHGKISRPVIHKEQQMTPAVLVIFPVQLTIKYHHTFWLIAACLPPFMLHENSLQHFDRMFALWASYVVQMNIGAKTLQNTHFFVPSAKFCNFRCRWAYAWCQYSCLRNKKPAHSSKFSRQYKQEHFHFHQKTSQCLSVNEFLFTTHNNSHKHWKEIRSWICSPVLRQIGNESSALTGDSKLYKLSWIYCFSLSSTGSNTLSKICYNLLPLFVLQIWFSRL